VIILCISRGIKEKHSNELSSLVWLLFLLYVAQVRPHAQAHTHTPKERTRKRVEWQKKKI